MLSETEATHANVFHIENPHVPCNAPQNTFTRYGRTRHSDEGSWRIPVRSGTGAYTYIRSQDAAKIHGILDCPFVRAYVRK